MMRRAVLFQVFLALMAVCSFAWSAENQEDQNLVPIPSGTTAELTTAIHGLSQQIAEMREDMKALASKSDVDSLEKRVAQNEKEIASLKSELYEANGTSKLAGIEKWLGLQSDEIAAVTEKTAAGQTIVDLSGNVESSEGRANLRNAVDSVLPHTGKLVIENRMAGGYTLRVNGVDYWIPSGETKTFDVASGTATTELVGYEEPRNWAITAPKWQETVIIGPSRNRPQVIQNLPAPSYYYDPLLGWVASY